MNYKVPRVLEKNPSILGINVYSFVMIAFSALFFIFTMASNFKISVIPILITGVFVVLDRTYNKLKGGLMRLILYPFTVHCIRFDRKITSLIHSNTSAIEGEDLQGLKDKIEGIQDKIDAHLVKIGKKDLKNQVLAIDQEDLETSKYIDDLS